MTVHYYAVLEVRQMAVAFAASPKES